MNNKHTLPRYGDWPQDIPFSPAVRNRNPYGFVTSNLLWIWTLLPTRLRIWIYWKALALSTKFRYGPETGTQSVRKIFPGLYLKVKDDNSNEAAVLRWLARNTDIPAPRVIDCVRTYTNSHSGGSHCQIDLMLITEVPGRTIMDVGENNLSDADVVKIARDLKYYFDQLRSIPSPWGSKICSLAGGHLQSYRFRRFSCGPFIDENEFNDFVLNEGSAIIQYPDQKEIVTKRLAKPHSVCFAHGDLAQANILICGGRVTGIVDWETSGFWPEYWDYARAIFPSRYFATVWQEMVRRFLPDYHEEYEVDLILWPLSL